MEDPLVAGQLAHHPPEVGVLAQALGEDVGRPLDGALRVGDPELGVDEGEGEFQGRADGELLDRDQLGQRLKAALAGDGRLGSSSRFEGEVEVLQLGFLAAESDAVGEFGGEFSLLLDALEDGDLPVGQLAVVGEQVLDLPDLHLVQFAGLFLSVAGDEGDGSPLVQKRHRLQNACARQAALLDDDGKYQLVIGNRHRFRAPLKTTKNTRFAGFGQGFM